MKFEEKPWLKRKSKYGPVQVEMTWSCCCCYFYVYDEEPKRCGFADRELRSHASPYWCPMCKDLGVSVTPEEYKEKMENGEKV